MSEIAEKIAHSSLGASSSSRWINCPASVAMSKDYPDESSPYAAHGSAAHHLCEKCLLDGTNAKSHLGEIIHVE